MSNLENTDLYANTNKREKEVAVANFLGITSLQELSTVLNSKFKQKTISINLDSAYAKYSSDCKKLSWDVSYLYDSPTGTRINKPIGNIIQIHALNLYLRKYASSSPTRMNVLIEEFAAQSFSLPNGRKFHFSAKPKNITNFVANGVENVALTDLTRVYIDQLPYRKNFLTFDTEQFIGKYDFSPPITQLNTLTLSIADPFDVIPIPQYSIDNVSIQFIVPTFTQLGYTQVEEDALVFLGTTPAMLNLSTIAVILTFDAPHNYPSDPQRFARASYDQYSLFIHNFTTDDPINDSLLIRNLNNTEFTSLSILNDKQILVRINESIKYGGSQAWPVLKYFNFNFPVGISSKVSVVFNTHRIQFNYKIKYIDVE